MREHTNLPENIIKDLVLLKWNAVGLRGAAYLMPPELSGGMARRVALARAIALDPDIIMYDEPFAGLDPISMAVICDLIRSLNDALGDSSIIVTHDVAETFSSDLAHEIRNPLTSLKGASEVLENTTDNEKRIMRERENYYIDKVLL
jgi:phospholipid/cholesterol/gamma-HCH transport system ATP-binding protein